MSQPKIKYSQLDLTGFAPAYPSTELVVGTGTGSTSFPELVYDGASLAVGDSGDPTNGITINGTSNTISGFGTHPLVITAGDTTSDIRFDFNGGGTGVLTQIGPSASAYAANLTDAQNIPNKYYVDSLTQQCFTLVVGDETTAITTGVKYTFRAPYAFTVGAVRASLTTAQASGTIFTVDIKEAGVSILSTLLTIDNTEKTSLTAATIAVISDPNLALDAEITVEVTQVGSGSAAGLKVYLIGKPA